MIFLGKIVFFPSQAWNLYFECNTGFLELCDDGIVIGILDNAYIDICYIVLLTSFFASVCIEFKNSKYI
jgi:hypothetical protein